MSKFRRLLPLELLGLAASSYVISVNAHMPNFGDSWCGSLICVDAFVNNTLVTYRLTALSQLGWMSIGFGTEMKGSPMVILWPHSNGSVILSQRIADGLIEPTPDPFPPAIAQVYEPLTSLSDIEPCLAFTFPRTVFPTQPIIWAVGSTNPMSPDPGVNLEQHVDSGSFVFNLTKQIDTSVSIPNTVDPPVLPFTIADEVPFTVTEKLIVGHAALAAFGFLFVLPLGAITARWGRSFTSKWFNLHWIIQLIFNLPIIVIGWSLGPLAVANRGATHASDLHKISGIILLVLYFLQMSLGTYIHTRRPLAGSKHPVRNIGHAILGIVIVGLAFFQVRRGFTFEWTNATGRNINAKLLSNLWTAWIIFIPTVYCSGFLLHTKRLSLGLKLAPNRNSTAPVDQQEGSSRPDLISRLELGPVDDGTHDLFSEPAKPSSRSAAPLQTSGLPSYDEIEMRQVAIMSPVSLSSASASGV